MQVRHLRPEDKSFMYTSVSDLEQIQFQSKDFDKAFEKILVPSNLQYWIAEIGGKYIGYFALRTEMQLHHCAPVAEIVEFYICKDMRNKGLGAEMLDMLLKIARNAGCVWAEVASSNWREDTHRFYLKNGFEKTHERFGRSLPT